MFYNILTTEEKKEFKKMDRDIAKAKSKLETKNVYENFGQVEVRAIGDKYYNLTTEVHTREQYFIKLDNFRNWCENYTGM